MPPLNPLPSKAQTGHAILSQFGKMLMGHQSTLLVGAFLMAIPAAWIAKVHMDWKPKPDAKKRMLIAQTTFWTSMLIGFKILHAALFALPDRKVLLPAGFFSLVYQFRKRETRGPAAAILTVIIGGFGSFIGGMIGGFEGGNRLAKAIVPKQSKMSQARYLTEVIQNPLPSDPNGQSLNITNVSKTFDTNHKNALYSQTVNSGPLKQIYPIIQKTDWTTSNIAVLSTGNLIN
jgi:hypothetical protein